MKSLNKSPGRRRFVFKTFSQRVEEIDIDVFRNLDPLKSEPFEGSLFFRDCLVEWRELNTAEEFISFYEEMMPLVQTLPQIILHKELILSKLLSRFQLKGRLYLEPILRLIAALSRDLLEDFPPFLQRVADSLASLLNNGADREPEIIEQIFTSWSYIMMYLQKYLVRDVIHVLRYLLEDMWETISELLLHRHMWLRDVLNHLVALYFALVTEANRENHEKPLGTFFLMRPSRLFLIAVSLCCQLKAPLIDNAASTLIIQNLAFAICGVHSLWGPSEGVDAHSIWSTLEHHEQGRFLKAFQLLNSGKGKSMFASLTSGDNNQNVEENGDHRQSLLVSFLLKRIGKIPLQTEAVQMKIVFQVLKSISPKIIDLEKLSSQTGDSQGYAFQMLLPLYKVCEGYAGKLIPDDVKQLAQETLESMRDTIGMTNSVQVYSQIRKKLQAKRDERKQEEKVMAVVNPMRNAKRKLRIAAKNRANKKQKVMTMKMTKWMR